MVHQQSKSSDVVSHCSQKWFETRKPEDTLVFGIVQGPPGFDEVRFGTWGPLGTNIKMSRIKGGQRFFIFSLGHDHHKSLHHRK